LVSANFPAAAVFVAHRYARKLSGRETSLLRAFALHAGVALRNANTFAMLSQALDDWVKPDPNLTKFSQIGPSPHKDNPRNRLQKRRAAMAYAPAHARGAALLASAGSSDWLRSFIISHL
jgi:hypothetical protein